MKRIHLPGLALIFLPAFVSAANVQYVPSNPATTDVVAAKEAFERGDIVAMLNADPILFGGMLNVPIQLEVLPVGSSVPHYCIAAARKTPTGQVRVYTGTSSAQSATGVQRMPALRHLPKPVTALDADPCQSNFNNWVQKQGGLLAKLGEDDTPQGWTYITSYTKSSTSQKGNSYSFTMDVYRANTTDQSNDYFMAVQTSSAAPAQGQASGMLAIAPKNGTFGLFDYGPRGLTYPGSFSVGGQVPGASAFPLVWTGNGGEYSAEHPGNQIGGSSVGWDWGMSNLPLYLDAAVFTAVKKTSQLAVSTVFSFNFSNETYPNESVFSIRVTSPVLSAPTDVNVVPGGAYSLAITASPYINWTVPSTPTWLSLDPTSGSGSQTVQFTVNSNAPVGSTGVIMLDSNPSYATPSVSSGPLQIRVHVYSNLLKSGVLLAGGVPWFSTVPLSTAEIWDPHTGNIVPTNGPMIAARKSHTATLLNNGKILIAGGYGVNGTALDTTEFFDPSSDTFSAGPVMKHYHASHTATLLNDGSGMVLIAGGVDLTGDGTAVAELYDPSSNTFTQVGNMLYGRQDFSATLLQNGTVLIAGGNTSTSGNSPVPGAEIYDPVTKTFDIAGPLIGPRWGHTAQLLTSGLQAGQVLIAGGLNATESALNTAELFTVNSGFSSTGNLPESGGSYPASVVLPNGTPVLFGGTPTLYNVTAYDPTAGTFSTIYNASLTEARERPTAVLIQNTSTSYDSKVLLAGGVEEYSGLHNGTPLDIYDPSTQTVAAGAKMSTSRELLTSTLFGAGGNGLSSVSNVQSACSQNQHLAACASKGN